MNLFRKSKIRQVFLLLPKSDLLKLALISVFQITLAFLDLLGVAAMGLLGALSVSGIQSATPDNRILKILNTLGLSSLTFQKQVLIIGSLACSLLLLRTVVSIITTRKVLKFMSRRSAIISAKLTESLLKKNILFIARNSTQENVYMLTRGIEALVLDVIGVLAVLVADVSLLLVILVGLAFYDISIAIGTLLVFGGTSLVLYRSLHLKSQVMGRESTKLHIDGGEKLIEILTSLREVLVRNRIAFYVEDFRKNRTELASLTAEMNFIPYVSKYVIETTILVGSLGIAALQFALYDAVHAVATLTIFLAAGSRLAPALLRVQQGLIQVRQGMIAGERSLVLLSQVELNWDTVETESETLDFKHVGFIPSIECHGVSFHYPGTTINTLTEIDLEITPGSFVAFVGTSGAGKSTLIDVILGVHKPNAGSVQISGTSPELAISSWPGAIAYVPQDVFIHSGTVSSNVAMGFEVEDFPVNLILEPLQKAHLNELLSGPLGMELIVGERGTTLSGGQRQRLGIARALFTKPKLLILDEATSSLDSETELSITNSILSLRGTMTIVVIAHRLSTIKNADIIYYVEDGKILAQGSFQEVRELSINFDNQAKLMGL